MFFMIFIKKLDQVIQKVISTPVPEDSVLNFGNATKKIFYKGPAQKNFKKKFKKHPHSFY